MTVSNFFGIIFKLILYPFILYWAAIFYFFNERNLEWSEYWGENIVFTTSFVIFILFSIFITITFIAYSIYNSKKALVIVFSPKYIIKNYWDDVNQAFKT